MKRSTQVGLLLMGTLAVGGGAYAVMPSENCQEQPGVARPDGHPNPNCNRAWRSSSGSYGYSGSHGSSSGSSSSSSSSSSQRQYFTSDGRTILGSGDHSTSSSTTVARGGFGSFGSHFSGGG